jgi:flagellar biosynthetic protein FliR
MLLPGIGEAELPAIVRVAMALSVTVLLLPVLRPGLPALPASEIMAAALVLGEVVCGLWLGFLARLVVLALPMAGQMIALMTGLASVLQPDAQLGAQATPIGRVLAMAAPVIVLSSGLYALPLTALEGSYRILPAGRLLSGGDGAQMALRLLGESFALSFRLAAPFILAGLVWQVTLGILARLVPRLQVYLVAMPGQILGGLALFAVLAAAILGAWQEAASVLFAALPGNG